MVWNYNSGVWIPLAKSCFIVEDFKDMTHQGRKLSVSPLYQQHADRGDTFVLAPVFISPTEKIVNLEVTLLLYFTEERKSYNAHWIHLKQVAPINIVRSCSLRWNLLSRLLTKIFHWSRPLKNFGIWTHQLFLRESCSYCKIHYTLCKNEITS